MEKDFWKHKTLEEMTVDEWEALCDRCSKCCLFKLREEDGSLHYTNVVCRLMDMQTCLCCDYANRHENVPDCVYVTPELARTADWLPRTCAYRLLAEGKELPWWHPLRSGRAETVRMAGQSVFGKVVSEDEVDEDDLEDMVADWF